MTRAEIKKFLDSRSALKERTIVIVDFGNVVKWENSLGWKVGIKELGDLVKHFSSGKMFLRRFYYGLDYGPKEKSTILSPWSKNIFLRAQMNGFEVISKRVKYMPNLNYSEYYDKKCDLDVEMTVDLIKECKNYDQIVIFSGDGDLAYAIEYLSSQFGKKCIIFGARDHVGREIIDSHKNGFVQNILFAEDFEYRLSLNKRGN